MYPGDSLSGAPGGGGRRRSQRVILTIRISVRSEDGPKDASFEEETRTLVVNAHGALIGLEAKVKKGQKLRLKNLTTQAQEVCKVVYLGSPADGKLQVGVEFLNPSPDFWHIAFPPEDWALPKHEPAAAE